MVVGYERAATDVEAEAMEVVLVAGAAEIVGANTEEVLAARSSGNREAAAAEAISDPLGVSGLV